MKNNGYELVTCLWELTLKCNFNCIHCGSLAGSARQQELSLNECFAIADQIIDLKCKKMTFIGGEVFLFKGWEKIANYFSDHGLIVNLMSNGYKIGKEEIDQIKFANLSNVGISLDGTETIHNSIRGNKRSFSQIQNAFNLLNKAGIQIAVVTSLLEMNFPILNELYQFLVNNNVNLWQIQIVNPMGNMACKKKLLLKRKHIPELLDFIREKNKERYMLIVAADNVGYYYKDSEAYIRGNITPIAYWTGCAAGINSVFIDSVGNVKGCGALYDDKFIEGNIKHTSLKEIWNNKENFLYNRKFKSSLLTGGCKDCNIKSVCKGGCRASNYFNTNSLYENAFCAHFC
jgi:radical SAM protein with 4Fe4S-binding SPASM domain